MLQEFKKFIMRGNVVDMAVGIIIGAAFTTIVKSLVDDLIMPPLGVIIGGIDFSNMFYVVEEGSKAAGPYASLAAAKAAGASVMAYGQFVNNVINFLIVAFAVFMLVRMVNKMKASPPPADPTTKDCPACLSTVPIKAIRCAHCTGDLKPA